jgi:hypothetical protein
MAKLCLIQGDPMPETVDVKLEKRKLDALKRGIHRVGEEQTVPFSVNLVGVGKAGADAVVEVLRNMPEGTQKISVLVIDIGDENLRAVRDLVAKNPGKADLQTIALEIPSRDDLFATLRRYREFLKLEYPRYYWNPNYEPWIPATAEHPNSSTGIKRAFAKALYGRAYYDGDRSLEVALRKFGATVDATRTQSVVAILFGAGDGTGSGIVVDIARHLSNVVFGRRALVVGIGILPCAGDAGEHDGSLFATLNELDCMGDQAKNEGVMAVWGDLDRNPFTGGVILVPREPAWQATHDLGATHSRVNQEIAALLTNEGGKDLFETLRMLNWVGAPPTQHAAARTAYGTKWAHVLAYADLDGPIKLDKDYMSKIGILPGYAPQFVEPRSQDEGPKADAAVKAIGSLFGPSLPPTLAKGGGAGAIQFVLPCVSKKDLAAFYEARAVYDTKSWSEKLMDHSWLLDLGVMLCEPAIRFEGMAGECLWGCACWVVVPYDDIRGDRETAQAKKPAKSMATSR